jgi:hypothetical protein
MPPINYTAERAGKPLKMKFLAAPKILSTGVKK